jgi:predicted dehydrogenase
MSAVWRWGIVGYGWVARDYMAPAIKAAGGKLSAVADPSSNARKRAEEEGAAAYSSIEELLEHEPLDAVYIASPNHLHAEAVERVAEREIPILCEKPLAHDAQGVDRIAQVAGQKGVFIATAFDQRHHPAHEVIRKEIELGSIGVPTAIRIVYCCWVDPQFNRGTGENWRADGAAAGGGAVLDLAPHGLDLAEFLLREPVERMSIVLQRRIHAYDVEDGGVIAGITRSGVLFSSHLSYNWPEALPRRRLEVAGNRGMIVASDTMGQDAGGHVTLLSADGGRKELVFDKDVSPFERQANAFHDMLAGRSHDFDIARDVAGARRFFDAYDGARQCL